jgi:hypothetical protein
MRSARGTRTPDVDTVSDAVTGHHRHDKQYETSSDESAKASPTGLCEAVSARTKRFFTVRGDRSFALFLILVGAPVPVEVHLP